MYLFPKLTKNTKVESATRYPDHQILSQSQGRAPFPYFIFPVPAPTHPPTLGPPGLLCKSASHRSASPGNSVHRLQCRPPVPPTHLQCSSPSQCPQAKSRASPAGTKRLRARFGLISGIGAAGLNRDLARNLFQEILLKFPPILPTECCHGKRRGKKVSMFLQLYFHILVTFFFSLTW